MRRQCVRFHERALPSHPAPIALDPNYSLARPCVHFHCFRSCSSGGIHSCRHGCASGCSGAASTASVVAAAMAAMAAHARADF
eukprot:5766650-Pleurochrysis_carterae.AAC.2